MVALPHIGILKTDGGPHPADMWAEASANEIANIVLIDEQSTSKEAKMARKAKPRFALDMADALEELHAEVQEHERNLLATEGSDRLFDEHDHDHILDKAVEEVLKIALKTPFSEEFKRPEIEHRVRQIIE